MKFSLNFIRDFNIHKHTAGDVTAIGVDKLIDKIGAQLGGVDEVIKLGDKYQGIVIVKVVECVPHPNADKLSLCRVDDKGVIQNVERGEDGLVQVVCGAPNAKAGMLAAWLPPGSTVPSSVGKEPFVLEAREIRGQKSNGMLASSKELALGESHEGILDIKGDYKPGADFAESFGLKDDLVIDIENKMFTHRPDLFGYLGIGRELAGIQQMPFKSPEWYSPEISVPAPEVEELKLEIRNELPQLVQRFTAIAMSDVKVGPSPAWLQVELAKTGQKSINNIVDYTNYFMLLTGQPLHAYDYDKVKALSEDGSAVIAVRYPKAGEKVKLLNGKEIEPRAEAIMIATDKQLIGVGGVMGGSETEVDEGTSRIILEAANFDMYSVRRTSMEHGLFTEASTRFTKAQSPTQTHVVIARTVDEIHKYAGGKVASEVKDLANCDDYNLFAFHDKKVKVTPDFINSRLGLQLSAEEIEGLLKNVEFGIEKEGDDIVVVAPFWRTDIKISEDVVEEVGRLYGYDKLPVELPSRVIEPTKRNEMFDLKAAIRDRLSQSGANEILTYSFVSGGLLDKVGQDRSKAFQVANALSPNLEYYRMSLMPSLLDKVHPNIKAGYDEFALFEIGKTHDLDHLTSQGLPEEFEITALAVTAADKLKKTGAAYYQAQKYLETLTRTDLKFKPIGDDMKGYPVVQPYEHQRSALVSIKGGPFLGIIGEFKQSVTRNLKLPRYSAGFEIDTTVLKNLLTNGPSYNPLSRFPKVKQDITLKVPVKLSLQEVYDFVDKAVGANAIDETHLQLEVTDIYQDDADKEHQNITFRLTITSYQRTLTDEEVNKMLDAVAEEARKELGAERV